MHVFKSNQLQAQFAQNGCVVLDNFFSPETLAKLNNLLRGFETKTEAWLDENSTSINKKQDGLFFTRHFTDLAAEQKLREQLSAIVTDALQVFLATEYKNT